MKIVDDNFLSDIENDIDGDWKEIQKAIRDKGKAEEIKNNPQRFYFPTYKDFSNILFRIFTSFDGKEIDNHALSDLHVLIRGIFYNHNNNNNPMPESFDRVWEIFCNPIKFKCHTGIRCEKCNERYDILIEHDHGIPEYLPRYGSTTMEMKIRSHCRIACPSCGYDILHLSGAKLIGVFSHEEKKPIGGRGNELKQKFESYF